MDFKLIKSAATAFEKAIYLQETLITPVKVYNAANTSGSDDVGVESESEAGANPKIAR